MSEAKEKDKILAQIKAFTPHNEIEGLHRHIDALKADGYVSVVGDGEGGIIVARITPQGERFLENGGYSARMYRKTPRVKSVGKGVWTIMLSVISGLIIAYLSKILGWI